MTNNTMLHIIEQDDLTQFKLHFNIEHWRHSITSIANYAGTSQYNPEVNYVDCDCLKYSVHCQADKIFNYLVSLVDTNQYGSNYGWPLLSMALKNERYDYAKQIISQPTFNYYTSAHIKCFVYIENRVNQTEHIDFLFTYLDKFNFYDYDDKHLIYHFTHLICFNEDTFSRFDQLYKKLHGSTSSILDIYDNHYPLLADEIFSRKFNPFIIEKLQPEQFNKMLNSIMDDSIIFSPLFESNYAKEGLTYLLDYPQLLQKYIDNHQVVISYLPLDCLILCMEKGINLWKNNNDGVMPLDYILIDSYLEDEKTLYFLHNYTQKIYDILELKNDRHGIHKYCHHKLLQEKFPSKDFSKYSSISPLKI